MADSVNMSLDEIIRNNQQNRVSRTRGRGGRMNRGRGNGRGGGGVSRGRGGGGISRGRGRGRSQPRPETPVRSRSRGPRASSQSRSRSQARSRSRSRQRRSNSRARSGSRSRSQLRGRGLTPKSRAGLEDQAAGMPSLMRGRFRGRGGNQNRMQRANSISSLYGGIHSRLGVVTRRGAANLRRPLAIAKRGISKRGRGLTTSNRYSFVGLRSDQIIKEQRQNMMYHDNVIKSQTFRRSRNNSLNVATDMTVTVNNDFPNKKRRNSVGSTNYLNKRSLAQLNNHFDHNTRRGPGSVKSMGSNRSNRSSRSNRSNVSYGSQRSTRSRGRGRGRGANRGVGQKFVSKSVLNADIQKQIAYLQGKGFGTQLPTKAPEGFDDFTPLPVTTTRTLHERFGF